MCLPKVREGSLLALCIAPYLTQDVHSVTSDSKDDSGDVASYTLPPPDVELKDGLELSLAEDSIKCKVMHTPGHSQVYWEGDDGPETTSH
jgi:glyoxylase-like metal-dependent hydrolase (beta-lactamase superfamily II)